MTNPVFTKDLLLDLADKFKSEFQAAKPFRHVVIDNFLPSELAEEALRQFPTPEEMEKFTFQRFENKIACRPDNEGCPPFLENLLNSLNGSKFCAFLEVLTGIDGLIPDPHFAGAGMHQVMDGGKLGIHIDFNRHKGLGLYRRLNVLIYLNKNWQSEYGGSFELWNNDGTEKVLEVQPVFNRLVVFETSSYSWHGHPEPMVLPSGVTRKSLIAYYYTSDQGDQLMESHWTRHQVRSGSVYDNLLRERERSIYKWTPPVMHELVAKGFARLSRLSKRFDQRKG